MPSSIETSQITQLAQRQKSLFNPGSGIDLRYEESSQMASNHERKAHVPSDTTEKDSTSSRQFSRQAEEYVGDEVLEDASFSDDESTDRPNRYRGSKTTYRNWIQAERNLCDSLDRHRDQNLSVHLYNAHCFKLRAKEYRKDSVSRTTTNTVKSKQKIKGDDNLAFIPPGRWTAWPMPPNEVPREGEDMFDAEDGASTVKMQDDPRPSATLEDCLSAQISRAAREKFNMRKPEGYDSDHEARNAEFVRKKADISGNGEDHAEDNSSILMQVSYPVPLGDEDKANQLAQPEVRHILSRFDDLLQALHRQRDDYALVDSPLTSGENSSGTKPNSARRGSRLSGNMHPKTEVLPDSIDISQSGTRDKEIPTSIDKPAYKKKYHDQQNTRDWADVIGLASISGWNPEVVNRAAKRCADLFQEDMLFRSLGESTDMKDLAPFAASELGQHEPASPPYVGVTTESIPEKARSKYVYSYASPSEDQLVCPIKPCKYSRKSEYTSFASLRDRDRHMQKSHPWFKTIGQVDTEIMYGGVHSDNFLEAVRPRTGYNEKNKRRGKDTDDKAVNIKQEPID